MHQIRWRKGKGDQQNGRDDKRKDNAEAGAFHSVDAEEDRSRDPVRYSLGCIGIYAGVFRRLLRGALQYISGKDHYVGLPHISLVGGIVVLEDHGHKNMR